jgi:cyclase
MKTLSRLEYLTLVLVVASALLPAKAFAQGDLDDVEIVAHHVSGSFYYLEGRGGNIGVSVGEDGIVMIDDQYAPLTDKIVAAIRRISDAEIRFLINTHVHGDHTGGNENMGRMGVLILARDEVRVRLAAQSLEGALPILTYSDAITIHLNGGEVYAAPLPPAHTDGDSYIYFRDEDVIHTGDVFRTVAFPIIDRNNGGTLRGTIEALAILAGLGGPNTIYVPGHGEVSTREDIVEFRDMVLTVRDRVAALLANGASYDVVSAAAPTAEWEARWGDPQRFLTAVYAELAGTD